MGYSRNNKWGLDEIERLKQLTKTHSYGQIAKILGKTRNAVIGKANRLSIESVDNTSKIKFSSARINRTYVRKKPLPKLIIEPIKVKKERVRLPENFVYVRFTKSTMKPPEIPSNSKCHYIYGDIKKKTAVWCCKRTINGTVWCKKHLKKIHPKKVEYDVKKTDKRGNITSRSKW